MILDGDITPYRWGALRGATRRLRELYSDIARLAPLSEPILILGATGTGKELVARELHNMSGRRDAYIPIHCPEMQHDLVSSELFGHEKGAFTGAERARHGLIASAGSGTVFLDEIGDLDLQSQAKLLRVLEDRKVRRVGANQFEDVRARIILATNRNLQEACAEGKFRRDLYERIRGFTLELPPLSERKADIPILASRFLDEYNEEYRTGDKMPEGSLDCLFHYDWPGNVRELRAVIRRAAAYADSSGYISPLILQESVRRPQSRGEQNAVPFDPAIDTWRDLLNRAQTIYLRALLAHTNGNREAAIKLSGLSKSQFFEKLKGSSKQS
jgi:two-component system response regulator HydG